MQQVKKFKPHFVFHSKFKLTTENKIFTEKLCFQPILLRNKRSQKERNTKILWINYKYTPLHTNDQRTLAYEDVYASNLSIP